MLFRIAANVRSKLSRKNRSEWEQDIESRLAQRRSGVSFRDAISRGKERFILEIKRTSPSNNGSSMEVDIKDTTLLYQECGADAISILTEETFFGGELADLAAARQATSVPLLRKDFIIDKLQIAEARAYGADAVLLIAALLIGEQLREFLDYSSSLQMDALVEVHSELELQRAIDGGATIIGVNNRDLQKMTIDLAFGANLLHLIPDHCLRVSESGLRTRDDVVRMRNAGADAFLIGTAVMRANDVPAKIRELQGK